jgi:hypothetical protein
MTFARSTAGAAWTSTLLLVLVALPFPARGDPANTLPELWRVLGACARMSDVPAAASGSEVTVLFSVRRDGSLIGRPQITHARLLGDATVQRIFLGRALAAVARCLPLGITDGLGGAIAGRPLRLRLTSSPAGRAI